MTENGSCCCSTDLQYDTKVLHRELLIQIEKGVSKDMGERPIAIQRLQADTAYLKQRLVFYYQRPLKRNFKWDSRYFYGIGDLMGELDELTFKILLQFKFKGAQEDQLRHTLDRDLRLIADENTLPIQNMETFRMTDGGNPLRYCTM